MKPGDTFNPRFEACGFHPEEIVAKRRDLTDGQKWLYDRLVRWARSTNGERPNERAGEVWRSHENIAAELGKSPKQIGRDMSKLESEQLIAHRKRDGRKSNTYHFLFHPDFERTPTSSQTEDVPEFEQTRMSIQKPGEAPKTENLNGHPRPVRADLNGHPRPSNQKLFNQQEHTPGDSGRLKEPSAASRSTASVGAFRGNQTSPAPVPAPRAYHFLFHPDFERTPTSSQTEDVPEFEQTRMSIQKPGEAPKTENLNGHPRPVRADLNGHPRPSNQKLFNQQEHTPGDSGRLKEPSAASRSTASVGAFRGNQTSPAPVPAPRANWPMGGWQRREDFETWWSGVVFAHPNKSRNADAKAKALEMIRAGQLERTQFDEGFAALRAFNSHRWAEHNSRYVPNLLRILDDSLWQYTARAPVASEYQDAESYLRRVANE